MALLGQKLVTLSDVAQRVDPDGKIPDIVELLEQTNELLMDMHWEEGNLPTGHRVTQRTGLPNVFWRILNKGVPSSKSTTVQVDEACGMLEARGQVDVKLARLNANVEGFRMSEAHAFIEAMNIEMASTVFYGNASVDPEEFNGLSVRYADMSAANGKNILDGGGESSDNTSIWLVCWSPRTIMGIYPKGSQAGLKHTDLGEDDVADADGNFYRALKDLWEWDCGIALKDWRYVVRIPNIDVSNLTSQTNAADLTRLMTKALHRLPGGYAGVKAGKCAFYCNRTVFQELDLQRHDAVKAGGQLSYDVVDGVTIPKFKGVPIRLSDALLESEAQVS